MSNLILEGYGEGVLVALGFGTTNDARGCKCMLVLVLVAATTTTTTTAATTLTLLLGFFLILVFLVVLLLGFVLLVLLILILILVVVLLLFSPRMMIPLCILLRPIPNMSLSTYSTTTDSFSANTTGVFRGTEEVGGA